jgi:hypothetical protein
VLVRLRIHLADGREALLSAEVDESPETPEKLLEQFNRDGRITLGDRETVPIEDLVKVELAPPEPQVGPRIWGHAGEGLAGEDVATAMEERFEKPAYEESS